MVLSDKLSAHRPTEVAGVILLNRILAPLETLDRTGGRQSAPDVRQAADGDLKSIVLRHLESFANDLSEGLQIEIEEQTVIVSGIVDSDDDRQLVMRIIGKVREVRSIRDCMEVAYPLREISRPSEPDDVWVAILGCWGQRN